MTIIQALEELLSCKTVNGNAHTLAYLEENDSEAKLKKLTLSGLTPGMLVIHIDKGRYVYYRQRRKQKPVAVCMSPLFRTDGTHDHNCSCDAVLIRVPNESSSYCELFYIELKSDSPSGFAKQFRSTRCFVRYVQILLEEFWDVKMDIAQERYIVFHTIPQSARQSIGKKLTRPSPNSATSPEAPRKRIVQNEDTVSYTQLF